MSQSREHIAYPTMQELLAQFFRVLASAPRQRLLGALVDGPRYVSDLVDEVKLPQATVSRHMRILADAGLVAPLWSAGHRYYQVVDPGTIRLLEVAQDITRDHSQSTTPSA